jgi:hypothetical protein
VHRLGVRLGARLLQGRPGGRRWRRRRCGWRWQCARRPGAAAGQCRPAWRRRRRRRRCGNLLEPSRHVAGGVANGRHERGVLLVHRAARLLLVVLVLVAVAAAVLVRRGMLASKVALPLVSSKAQ